MTKSKRQQFRDMILDLMKSKCTDTSRRISENMDRSVSSLEWLKIGFHLALCEHCREYKTQLKTLRHLTHGLEKEAPSMETQGFMKTESKEKLKQIIEKNT
jgi:hypothetical protein